MYIENRAAKSRALTLLNEARADIEDYGWLPKGAEATNDIDPYGTYPRCPWIAIIRVTERIRNEHPTEDIHDALFLAEDGLIGVTHVKDIGEFFDLNDSQPLESGKEWALDVLRRAASFVNGVPVADSETREMATDSIESPDIGSTISVVNRVKQWFKALRQGK